MTSEKGAPVPARTVTQNNKDFELTNSKSLKNINFTHPYIQKSVDGLTIRFTDGYSTCIPNEFLQNLFFYTNSGFFDEIIVKCSQTQILIWRAESAFCLSKETLIEIIKGKIRSYRMWDYNGSIKPPQKRW